MKKIQLKNPQCGRKEKEESFKAKSFNNNLKQKENGDF